MTIKHIGTDFAADEGGSTTQYRISILPEWGYTPTAEGRYPEPGDLMVFVSMHSQFPTSTPAGFFDEMSATYGDIATKVVEEGDTSWLFSTSQPGAYVFAGLYVFEDAVIPPSGIWWASDENSLTAPSIAQPVVSSDWLLNFFVGAKTGTGGYEATTTPPSTGQLLNARSGGSSNGAIRLGYRTGVSGPSSGAVTASVEAGTTLHARHAAQVLLRDVNPPVAGGWTVAGLRA